MKEGIDRGVLGLAWWERWWEKYSRWLRIRTSPASMAARLGTASSLRCRRWFLSLSDLPLLLLALEGGGDIDVRSDVGGVVFLVGLV